MKPGDSVATASLAERAHTLPDHLVLMVVTGANRGKSLALSRGTFTVGKSKSSSLVLTDPAVSRSHLQILVLPDAVEIRDLGSRNGSFFGGARFERIRVGVGAAVRIGSTEMEVQAADHVAADGDGVACFGELLAASDSMKKLFSTVQQLSNSNVPMLVVGETGTGKELLARAIHRASPRAGGPMVVCDLTTVSYSLIESELFGHCRGAFTGADRDREGAFESAHQGTLFLDEIGELDAALQPRLLRALESGQVKRVGETRYRRISVRVVAATHRDLAREADAGRFRLDLYHRLAVGCVRVPPLRDRPEDIPVLVDYFLSQIAPTGRVRVQPATMEALMRQSWPGNARQLRNVLERAVSLAPRKKELDDAVLGLEDEQPTAAHRGAPSAALSFKDAKNRLIDAWERDYLVELVHRAEGNLSLAARRAGLARGHLHRLLKKHALTERA